MEDYIEINYKKLRKIRKEKGLSITKVAKEINIPAATFQKYETGLIKKIPLNLLKKYVPFMKQNIFYFLQKRSTLFLILFSISLLTQVFIEKERNF